VRPHAHASPYLLERSTLEGIQRGALSPSAYAHGLAPAVPEMVELARPIGVERADAVRIRIPVVGAEIMLASA